jgi:hypothetical protein
MKIKVHRTVILPSGLYEFEIWSLTLREGQWQRVFENGMLMKIFGPTRDEATRKWRRLQNEQHYDLYLRQIMIMIYTLRHILFA